MKNALQTTLSRLSLKAVTNTGPVLPYTGMYIKVNFGKNSEKPSPFKAQFQTGALAKEAASWDAEWFAHYE